VRRERHVGGEEGGMCGLKEMKAITEGRQIVLEGKKNRVVLTKRRRRAGVYVRLSDELFRLDEQ